MTLHLCEQETIQIRTWSGVVSVSAHRFQEFAAHQFDNDLFEAWRITHLPSGHLVARDFSSLKKAADAMIEIARLRNDWAVIRADDLTAELKAKVKTVVDNHQGRFTSGARPLEFGLNGYVETND